MGVMHLDELLEELGSFGPHQRRTLLLLALVYATNSMYNINYVFAVENVGYRCQNPCNSTESGWLGARGDDAEGPLKQCTLPAHCGDPSAPPQPCDAWIYDNDKSFVAEFNLGCQEWKQTQVGTAHMLGNMLGLLVQGQISDRFGRKKAAVFAGSAGAVLGLAKSCATSYWPYVALELMEAAFGDALSPIFMLSIEIVPKKHAVLFQMLLLNCYTGGLILMALIAWAVPYWRYFLRIIYAPTLIVITYSFFLDESIRWLFSKGRTDEAHKLIRKIAKRNGVDLDKRMLEKLEYIDDEAKETSDLKLLLKTFKSKIMMQRFLVCLVWWVTTMLINYGMMISSVLVAGDKYVNFALLMMMDVPANVFYWLALAKYKRKMPLFISFLVGGLFSVCVPFVSKSYGWLALALFMSFEMLATFSANIVYIYTSELFPTYTRNSMHALCSAAGRAGALLAPQVPLLMTYWSGLPTLLFGLTSVLSGLLTLSMPETAALELPDTVLQAEDQGRVEDIGLERGAAYHELISKQSSKAGVETEGCDYG